MIEAQYLSEKKRILKMILVQHWFTLLNKRDNSIINFYIMQYDPASGELTIVGQGDTDLYKEILLNVVYYNS